MSVFVILPAAGIGTRMASATGGAPKQFIELGGIPILLHSLRAFLAVPRVTGIYVAVREPDQPRVSALLAEHRLADRVHVVAGGALVTATIPRELIVHAQTPQGAKVPLMRRAFSEAAADEFVGTDEASLLERANIPVYVVPGSYRNLKVTQPGDLEIAEFYLTG